MYCKCKRSGIHMDRESRQKVIIRNRSERKLVKLRYVLWTLAAVATLILLFICGMSYAGNIREEQMRELITIHPEFQRELQDNFSYYQGQVVRLAWIAMTASPNASDGRSVLYFGNAGHCRGRGKSGRLSGLSVGKS